MADGTIIIKMTMDSSGMKTGESTVKKTLSGIQKSFQSAAGSIAKSNDLIGVSLTNQNQTQQDLTQKAAKGMSEKVKNSTNGIGASIGNIGKQIRGLLLNKALFPVLYNAFSALFSYMRTAIAANAQFSSSFAQIKGNLLAAFQPIYEFIMPALNALMAGLARITAYIAAFFSAIFGKTLSSSKKSAQALYSQTKAYDTAGKAAKEAGKEDGKSTTSFDELNVISENKTSDDGLGGLDSGGGIGETALDFSMGEIDTTPVDTFLENLKTSFDNFKLWWDTNFKPIFDNIFENMQPQMDTFKTTLSGMFSDIGTLAQPLEDWFNNNFTPFLQTAASELGNITVGIFDSFNRVFSDIWNIVVYPVFLNLMTTILPIITEFGRQAVLTFGTVFENAKMIFDMLWSQAVSPALSLIVSMWLDVWSSIDLFWQEWGVPIFEAIRQAINMTGEILVTVWNSFLKPVWDTFMETVDWLWSDHIKPLLDNFLDFVGELINCALVIYNNVIAPVVNWLVETLGPIWANVFQTILSVAGSIIGAVCDLINGLLTSLKGIIEFISGVFSQDWGKAWTGIKNVFKGIWDMLVGIVKGVINIIIDLVNGMIRLIENAVNGIISGINSITGIVGIPAISEIEIPKIPKLAQGSVIPPNREFLALLGDNKKETEVVSPLSTMKQALAEVIQELGNTGGNTVILELDGREVGRTFLPIIKKEERRVGVRLGGVYA